MITNENFVKILIENDSFSKKLIELFNDVHKEKINIKRYRNQQKNIYHDFNKARGKMIKFLFDKNKEYNFMHYIPFSKYNYLIEEIQFHVYGIKIADALRHRLEATD